MRHVTTTLRNYVTAYAATHPQEDFAETFRVYVVRRGRLRELFGEFGRKRKCGVLFEKVLVLHDYVRSRWGWRCKSGDEGGGKGGRDMGLRRRRPQSGTRW